MAVFVLDRRGEALMPCSEKRARLLLARGRARVHKAMPFAIRLVDRKAVECELQALRLKIDPGSKITGMALVREADRGADKGAGKGEIVVLNLFELVHRGRQISEALTARRQMRRRRRSQLRYRAPRFLNRGNKSQGWLAPSLQHRVDTTLAWVKRLGRLAPVSALSVELVRFDMQALQNPEIEGAQYQQGTLAGYEVREYLLEKWERACAYCGAKDVPLQVEHIHPRSKGGSSRISNLTLACSCCNRKKAALPIEVFLSKQPERLQRILKQAKRPLKDAAAVNSTRWALVSALQGVIAATGVAGVAADASTGMTLETASGGQTKFNRSRLNIPKTHALDAACVGVFGSIADWNKPSLRIKCTGRGSYQRTRLDKFGFPRGYLMRQKSVKGFATGDMVQAKVTEGKKQGSYRGRVAVRASGSFNIQTSDGLIQGVSHRYCTLVQRGNGYGYQRVAKTDATGVIGAPPKPRNTSCSTLCLPMDESRGFPRKTR